MENIEIKSEYAEEKDNNIVESTKEKYEALDEKVRNKIRKIICKKSARSRVSLALRKSRRTQFAN